MTTDYIVKYMLGNICAELHVSAHDEEQAKKIAELQAHYRHRSKSKFLVLSVRREGEDDPLAKELEKFRAKRC
jgi:hypothetical protein